MGLGFWNLPMIVTRRGCWLPSSSEGNVRDRARVTERDKWSDIE
jgi:hypothetical protein